MSWFAPAATIADGGKTTLGSDSTVRLRDAGTPTLFDVSTAVAWTLTTSPGCSVFGMAIGNTTAALPTGGETAFEVVSEIAPLAVRSTRATAVSSSTSATRLTVAPRTTSSRP